MASHSVIPCENAAGLFLIKKEAKKYPCVVCGKQMVIEPICDECMERLLSEK